MFGYIFFAIMFLHGLIHLMGFTKAFKYAEIAALTGNISKPAGILWLCTSILLITASFLFISGKSEWLTLAVAGAALSQILVATHWRDAKAGTIANIIIFLIISN